MTKDLVYIVTDGEYDGPVPGRNSMLSFASVAITPDGEVIGEFEATLEPLEGAQAAPETMAFWQIEPEAYRAATLNPMPSDQVMKNYTNWIRGLKRDAIFVSHPAALDGAWIDFYLQRYTDDFLLEGPWKPNRLFKAAPLCLVTYIQGRLGRSPLEYGGYPAEWLGHIHHTHKAIDDARGYAHLLIFIKNLGPTEIAGACTKLGF